MSDALHDGRAREVLASRTRALARPVRVEQHAALDVLVLRVAGERYGLPPDAVREVAEVRKLTPLPHAPPQLLGLTSRNGSIVPVFDLRVVLGMSLSSLPEHGRVVLLGEDRDAIAFAVEAIEGTALIAEGELAGSPDSIGPSLRAAARGVTASGLVVLDPVALLASELLVVDVPLPRDRR